MKRIIKEYGVIATLVIVAVAGYFIVRENSDVWLNRSLDVLGEHLVSLVDDPQDRDRIANSFDQFRQKVDNREVAPEQLEVMAANILNLTTRGARLSQEEAEMVIQLAEKPITSTLTKDALPSAESPQLADAAPPPDPQSPAEPVRPPSPRPPTAAESSTFLPSLPPDRADWSGLGKRIGTMFVFADSARHVTSSSAPAVRYVSGPEGLQAIFDSTWTVNTGKSQLYEMARDLNSENMLRWEAREMESSRVRMNEEAVQNMARLRAMQDSLGYTFQQRIDLEHLVQLQKLSSMGVQAGLDSARTRVDVRTLVDQAMKDMEKVFQDMDFEILIESSLETAGSGTTVGNGSSGSGTAASSSRSKSGNDS